MASKSAHNSVGEGFMKRGHASEILMNVDSVAPLMDTTIPIPFPFPLEDNDEADLFERTTFWVSPSTREWFRQRGYVLYAHNDVDPEKPSTGISEPTLNCKPSSEMRYPYPHYESEGNTKSPLRVFEFTGKVVYAQEMQDTSHHVAIKLIVTDSEEHRILQYLQSQGMEVLKENCLVPVLEILSNGPFSFIVMPRWGTVAHFPKGCPIRNVLHIVHSLLKAISFLHENNILHRDIKFGNVLVSHFGDDTTLYRYSQVRSRLQWSNELSYCLFDFDISMMLPMDTDRARCRLPYRLCWDGSLFQPKDTAQGEFNYDPFAYDVGTLGRVLCVKYQHLTQQIPMLAPFLDRMVTRNIPLRFNAVEALRFFEAILPQIPENVMNLVYPEKLVVSDYEWDRWEGLPADFIKKWEGYREPPIPSSTSVLRWICSFRHMRFIVPAVRLFFFRLTLVPSRIRIFLGRMLWHLTF